MKRHPIAISFAAAVANRDGEQLAATVTDTVRLRALLPGGPVESHGRDAVIARFAGWFADFDTVELVDATDATRLPMHAVVQGGVPGRSGTLALQAGAFLPEVAAGA